MRFRIVLRYVGYALLLNGAFLFLSALVAALTSGEDTLPLAFSGLACLLFGLFPLLFVPSVQDVTNTEGLAIVVYSWLACCLTGTIPYVLWGHPFSFTNAVFESVSGYTTTGATILSDIESLPVGLLFWRSLTQWIGGVGILVFVLAILPFFAGAESTLYRAETSSLSRESFQHRTRTAIRILLFVYAGLTALQTIALLACGLPALDAVTTSFATIATGGFSVMNESISAYHSLPVEVVTIFFMVASGFHFGLLFALVHGKFYNFQRSTAARYYLGSLLVGTAAVFACTFGSVYESWGEALRYSSFQVVSLATSTGFATADTVPWPPFAQLFMILLTLQCACAGSTSGGIKVDRVAVFLKGLRRTLGKTVHPSAVIPLKVDGETIGEDVAQATTLYILAYLGTVVFSTLVLAGLGVDLLSAFSGSAACMGNVGPGFGQVGSVGNYGSIPEAGKWMLSLTMFLGRLEIYGVLSLVMLAFTRRR